VAAKKTEQSMDSKQEFERREIIDAIGARHGMHFLAAEAINAGTPVETFRLEVLRRLGADRQPVGCRASTWANRTSPDSPWAPISATW
jgi:hypothetical protein